MRKATDALSGISSCAVKQEEEGQQVHRHGDGHRHGRQHHVTTLTYKVKKPAETNRLVPVVDG